MESGKTFDRPEARLMYLVDGMRRCFGDQLRRELGDHPYTDVRRSELRLLLLIPRTGATLTTLADLTGLTKQSLSEFVDRLKTAGYLTTATDPEDRRVKLIRPTPRGRVAQRHILHASRAVENAWRSAVGSSRYDSMKEVLTELAGLAESHKD